MAGVGHHGLHHAHFFVVEIEQRAVGFDTGSAEDGVIHFELVDEIDGGHAGDAAVHRPHHAGGDDDGVVRPAGHDGGNVDIVGDDAEVFMVFHQRERHGFDGGTDAHKQGNVVWDVLGNQVGNVGFFALQLVFARVVVFVLHAAAGRGAAVVAAQDIVFAQNVDVAADGLRGHV